MSRMQKTDGTSRCFAQIENIKRQSLFNEVLMDYTIANKYVSQKCIACGIDLEYLFRHETLYYDESGNDKHLIVKGDKLNTDPNLVFVLGGIQSEDTIKLEDLKARMGKAPTTELKSSKDLKGNFVDIIGKDNLKVIFQLILEKNWHIHFNAIQILYYGFVDIVDSVPGLSQYPFEFKAILYNVLKKDSSRRQLLISRNTSIQISKAIKYMISVSRKYVS